MAGPDPRPGILSIAAYQGGAATIEGVADVLKLSSNENALGASPKAIEAVRAAAARLHLYPNGGSDGLRAALAAKHGIEAERIVCGAGSDEILQLLAKAYLGPGDKAVQSRHGFLVYKIAAQAAGAEMVMAPEREDTADVDAMIAAADDPAVKLVFLANPNNPTGTMLGRAEIERLHAGLRADQFLVLDGAYAEFLSAAEDDGAMALARSADNVIVTRTFSKIYGLAALRVGWGCMPANAADVLNRIRGPFNVNAPAQAAALAALEDTAFVEASLDHNNRWRAALHRHIEGLGFSVTPSFGNFLLVGFGSEEAAVAADAFFKSRGLIFRAVKGYGFPDRLRVSFGDDAANERVKAAFAELAVRRGRAAAE